MLGLSCRLTILLLGGGYYVWLWFFFEIHTAPKSYKLCLPMIKSYRGALALTSYSTILVLGVRCNTAFSSWICLQGRCKSHPPSLFEGVIRSAPWMRHSPLHSRYVLIRHLFRQKGGHYLIKYHAVALESFCLTTSLSRWHRWWALWVHSDAF